MKFQKPLISFFIALCITMLLSLFPVVNFAQELHSDPAPIVMLKQTTSEMLSVLKENKADIQHNRDALYRIVNKVLVPHIDQDSMAQQVVGREYWANASTEDRQLFIQEFLKVIVRTYSAALTSYSNQEVKFSPLREEVGDKTHLEVKSQIVESTGSPVEINYRLVLAGEGQWKVRDFSVDGVSLVQNYHSQFAQALAQKGFSGLLKELSERNNQGQGS
jgi:phospholipid transport system substrate-binding protein